jgi:hypothetical protein
MSAKPAIVPTEGGAPEICQLVVPGRWFSVTIAEEVTPIGLSAVVTVAGAVGFAVLELDFAEPVGAAAALVEDREDADLPADDVDPPLVSTKVNTPATARTTAARTAPRTRYTRCWLRLLCTGTRPA